MDVLIVNVAGVYSCVPVISPIGQVNEPVVVNILLNSPVPLVTIILLALKGP